MPKPPPRSSSGSSTPCSSRICAEQPDARGGRRPRSRRCRRSASRCASAGRRSSSDGRRRGSGATASAAAPPASEKPNFWSSWAVAMNSWVCASTPTVTRTSTRGRTPALARRARPAGRSRRTSRRRSGRRRRRAPRRSSAHRLVVAVQARSAPAGIPAAQRDRQLAAGADVEAAGPPRRRPADDRRAQERLAGVVDVARRRTPSREVPAAGPEVGLVEDVRPGCRTRRRASRTSTPPTLERAVGVARSTVARPERRHAAR